MDNFIPSILKHCVVHCTPLMIINEDEYDSTVRV